MNPLNQIGLEAKEASTTIARLKTDQKNNIIRKAAEALINGQKKIIEQNAVDVSNVASKGITKAFLDRLTLNRDRIHDMAKGLNEVADLDDPVGEFVQMKTLPNGLLVGQKRVPMGVIGIIYEARPNVTADAFALCFKAGSSVILRGGSEAIHSNQAIVDIFKKVLAENGVHPSAVQLLTDTSRETAQAFMRLNQYVDVLIPRGGAGLIKAVVENSTIPVIETGVGNCHIFVDESADIQNAIDIIINAKTQRPGVCNACEKLLVHEGIIDTFLPEICHALKEKGVEIHGDRQVLSLIEYALPAVEEDWSTEYLDMIIGIKVVADVDAAIHHIQQYSSGHSEAILTESYQNTQRFLNEIDSAAVYVNASTRFTDGQQFGFGAEIGISTQKLHARGPMGLKELTSTKYIIYGNGQIRE